MCSADEKMHTDELQSDIPKMNAVEICEMPSETNLETPITEEPSEPKLEVPTIEEMWSSK